ncbi:MAG: putative photosynthetic complex assembly protein PuhE [Roseiarcus sp.]|jgi:putative photosynthetic complex assembly protein 2
MARYGLPIAYTLLLWWSSTALILYLDGLPRRTFVWSMAGATALLAVALWGLVETGGSATATGAYLAFACGLLAWGWQLVSFYMGYVTGPRKTACAPDWVGWRRFIEAVRTSLYHELTVVVTAAAMLALTWRQPNQIALWTFVALWWMHQSAKLNVFFGVPNLGEELLPPHLRYLLSYMTRKPMNLLFPVSVSLSTVLTVLLAQKAAAADATPFEAAGFTMLATLMALAIAEHWFLVTPLETNALWRWGVKTMPAPAAVELERRDPALILTDVREPVRSHRSGVEPWSEPLPALVCDP